MIVVYSYCPTYVPSSRSRSRVHLRPLAHYHARDMTRRRHLLYILMLMQIVLRLVMPIFITTTSFIHVSVILHSCARSYVRTNVDSFYDFRFDFVISSFPYPLQLCKGSFLNYAELFQTMDASKYRCFE